jgi:regulatory protein
MTGGIITALEVQKRNPKRVNVYLDGVFAFSLTLDEAARLHQGQTLTADEIAALQQQDQVQRAVDAALRFLAPRPRSIHEMQRKLVEKGFDPQAIAGALDHLTRLGYLDDAAFANFWVRERQISSPLSPRALRYELRRKGVSGEVIEAALAELDAAGAALQAAEAHARRLRGLTRREFHDRLAAHLQRRGFSYSQARQAIQTLIERTEPEFAPEPDTASSRRTGSGLKRSGLTRRVQMDRSDDEAGDYGMDES